MKTSEKVPDVFQEKEITKQSLTEEEKQELHIEDELQEMELFFSKEFDEMELRFQDYEIIY
ncbi:hypothetical protein [Cloacibacterium sp.]|mgnify:CR=1 FL=1|uniref:hypothetical protein n=1 Tax=Cloacibacterium sp. TaxID=1913682 RepID=UPI0039E4F8EA